MLLGSTTSTRFPYTTLFRSRISADQFGERGRYEQAATRCHCSQLCRSCEARSVDALDARTVEHRGRRRDVGKRAGIGLRRIVVPARDHLPEQRRRSFLRRSTASCSRAERRHRSVKCLGPGRRGVPIVGANSRSKVSGICVNRIGVGAGVRGGSAEPLQRSGKPVVGHGVGGEAGGGAGGGGDADPGGGFERSSGPCPNFSSRNRPFAISLSMSERFTASDTSSICSLSTSSWSHNSARGVLPSATTLLSAYERGRSRYACTVDGK